MTTPELEGNSMEIEKVIYEEFEKEWKRDCIPAPYGKGSGLYSPASLAVSRRKEAAKHMFKAAYSLQLGKINTLKQRELGYQDDLRKLEKERDELRVKLKAGETGMNFNETKKYQEAVKFRDWQTCDLIADEHKELVSQINQLKDELSQAKQEIEVLEESNKFYASIENCEVCTMSHIDFEKFPSMSGGLYYTGFRAREAQKKLQDLINELPETFDPSISAERYHIWCKHHQKVSEIYSQKIAELEAFKKESKGDA